MIKRLSARRSHGTLVANPRKKRNGKKRHSAKRKHRSLSALMANPRRKHKKANPKRSHKRRNPISHRRKRNPAIGGIDFGGVNLVNVGVGSLATIALGSIGQAVFDKYLSNTIQNETLRKVTPNLLVAGAAFLAHKYMKNQMVKDVAKVTIALSVFKAIDDSVGTQVKEGVQKLLPGSSGAYVPVSGNYALSGGMYIDTTTGGGHAMAGIMPGANLYGL